MREPLPPSLPPVPRALWPLLLPALLSGSACLRSFDAPAPQTKVMAGQAPLVRSAEEAPGARCPGGGVRVEHGTDADGDGVLDDEEVEGAPIFLCRGEDVAAPPARLVRVVAEPAGGGCEAGGSRVEMGVDADGDGVLDDEEVESEARVCHGVPGARGGAALVEVTRLDDAPGCGRPGQRVAVGLDLDGDEVLDEEEVAFAEVVCDGMAGADGEDGANGSPALVAVAPEERGASCPAGGQRVEVGRDDDGDGVLDDEEVEQTTFVCHGEDGQGSGAPAAGVTEGTIDAPVAIAPGRFDGGGAPRASTVAALETSFYVFETFEAAGTPLEAPYTIALLGTSGAVGVALYSDADFATGPLALACHQSGVLLECASPPLADGQPHYLAISSLDAQGDTFGLTVSLGAGEGSAEAPLDSASRAVPLGGGLSFAASVRGGGESHYTFVPPSAGVFTLGIEQVRAAPGETPGLRWELYDDGIEPLVRCQEACPTPPLQGGQVYRVRLFDESGAGAALDVALQSGDLVTEALPLDTVIVRSASEADFLVLQLSVPTDGDYTIQTHTASEVGVWVDFYLFDDGLSAARYGETYEGVPLFECYDTGCAVPGLVGGRTYYLLAIPYSDGVVDVSLRLSSRAGSDGLAGAPLPLVVGAPQAGSTTEHEHGYYSFVAEAGGRYTVRVSDLAGGELECRLYDDAGFTIPSTNYFYDGDGQTACVSEPVAAGTTVYARVSAYLAHVYEIVVEAGDTVTPTLPVGGGPVHVSLAPYASAAYRFPTTGGAYLVRVTGAAGDREVALHRKHPENASSAASIEACDEEDLVCELDGFIAGGVSGYVELRNRTSGRNEMDIEVIELPIVELTLGAAVTGEVVGPKQVRWYRFSAPGEAAYTASVTVPGPFVYRTPLYRGDDGILVDNGALRSGVGPQVHAISLGTLAPGDWLFRIDELDGRNMGYDIVIDGP